MRWLADVRFHQNMVKHGLDVRDQGNRLFSKTHQDKGLVKSGPCSNCRRQLQWANCSRCCIWTFEACCQICNWNPQPWVAGVCHPAFCWSSAGVVLLAPPRARTATAVAKAGADATAASAWMPPSAAFCATSAAFCANSTAVCTTPAPTCLSDA